MVRAASDHRKYLLDYFWDAFLLEFTQHSYSPLAKLTSVPSRAIGGGWHYKYDLISYGYEYEYERVNPQLTFAHLRIYINLTRFNVVTHETATHPTLGAQTPKNFHFGFLLHVAPRKFNRIFCRFSLFYFCPHRNWARAYTWKATMGNGRWLLLGDSIRSSLIPNHLRHTHTYMLARCRSLTATASATTRYIYRVYAVGQIRIVVKRVR